MKDKIKNIIEKNEKVIAIIFIIIATSAFAFNVNFEIGDELWNFSNVSKMSLGETIYQDCNVIITPLFFYIGKFIFSIFGNNYLVFRIYNMIIYIAFYYIIYEIFSVLNISKIRKVAYMGIIYLITMHMIMLGANYNILALIFVLLGILYNIKSKKQSNIIQGLLIFITFMCKQNIGIYYAIGNVIYNLLVNQKINIEEMENKKANLRKYINIKQTIKNISKQLAVFTVLFAIYCVYLQTKGILWDFINYAFLGIAEFGKNNISTMSIGTLIAEIITIIVVIAIINCKKIKIGNVERKNIKILISHAIPMLLISYPLINTYHVRLSGIIIVILFIYMLDKALMEELLEIKVMKNIFITIDVIILITITTFSVFINSMYKEVLQTSKYDVYYGTKISDEIQKDIEEIIKYIKQNEQNGIQVKIISYKSNLYMNILKRNNGDFDLPFYGNLGVNGEDGLIEKIKALKNTNILIRKEEDKVFQESKKVREYIMNNYEKIGELGEFYIYKVNS